MQHPAGHKGAGAGGGRPWWPFSRRRFAHRAQLPRCHDQAVQREGEQNMDMLNQSGQGILSCVAFFI